MRRFACSLAVMGLALIGCQETTTPGPADAASTDGGDGTDAGDATDGTDGTETSEGTDGGDATDDPGGTDGTDGASAVSYHTHVKPVLDQMCVRCHSEGGIRETTPLGTYDDVQPLAMLIKQQVVTRTMPPWKADSECREYAHDESLSEEEIAWIAEWADAGAPEGDAAAKPMEVAERTFATLTREDLELTMEYEYVPGLSPDDYRCFVLDWTPETKKYITGFGARPGNPKIVHHVIAYIANPDIAGTVTDWDANDEGAGYTCFGGPTATGQGGTAGLGTSLRFLGGWAPGGVGADFPAGTGMGVEPGSKIILQVHYNTIATAPEPDKTSFVVKLDDSVEKEAFVLPWTNFQWLGGKGMEIPAGEKHVTHAFASDPAQVIGFLAPGGGGGQITLHTAALHMHTLGTAGTVFVQRKDGDTECLLDIADYDFGWQRTYGFVDTVALNPGDKLGVECHWDNSPENQIWIDGEQLDPVDQKWGEGTTDEMCIAFFYVTLE